MPDPALKTSKLAYQVIGDIQRVSPQPGDVIVIEHKLPLATGDRLKVQQQFQSLFPNNNVVVMQAGMEMKLVGNGGGNG
jgi:hypothetical protein